MLNVDANEYSDCAALMMANGVLWCDLSNAARSTSAKAKKARLERRARLRTGTGRGVDGGEAGEAVTCARDFYLSRVVRRAGAASWAHGLSLVSAIKASPAVCHSFPSAVVSSSTPHPSPDASLGPLNDTHRLWRPRIPDSHHELNSVGRQVDHAVALCEHRLLST